MLGSCPQLELNDIQGAFYAFPKLKPKSSSTEFSKKLLQSENVAVLPGIAFGGAGEGRFRISFSGGTEELETGLDKITGFLRKIS